MKLKNYNNIMLATVLAVSASSAYAGNFVNLTSGVSSKLTQANGGVIAGSQNQNVDKLYIQTQSATYLAGYDNLNAASQGGKGDVVATTINYRAFAGAATKGTGTLTLLDWNVTRGVDLAPGSHQADIYDFVYQDSADGSLVFGTRYLNRVANNEEVNFLYRYGFQEGATTFATAAAWTYLTNYDLRQYTAARTSSNVYLNASHTYDLYDSNTVQQKGDFSLSEGNPWSGLLLVKTDAKYYTTSDKAIGFYQAGEEGQKRLGGYIGGFVPTNITPVPEADTYAMLLAGLGFMGCVLRRRKNLQ